MRKLALGILFGLIPLLVIACSTSEPVRVDARDLDPYGSEALCAYHIGDPVAGKALFNQPVLAAQGGCVTCHSVEPNTVLVGPSLYGIATTAEERIPNIIAANYIYMAIVEPTQHVLDVFPADVMPLDYRTELDDEEITNLVSYLMTLTKE